MEIEDYEKSMLEDYQSRQAGVAATIASVDISPEEAAKNKRIAGVLGVPLSVVEGDTDTAKRLAAAKTLETDTEGAPGLKQKYTDADFAKLAVDQAAPLGVIERTVRNLAAGFGGDVLGSGIKGLGHTLNSLRRTMLDATAAQMRTQGIPVTDEEIAKEKASIKTGDPVRDLGQVVKEYWQAMGPQDEQTFTDQVARGIGQMAAQLPLMATGVGAAAGLGLMYGQGADQMYEKIANDKAAQKADQVLQDAEILSGGLITGATEWLSSKLLLKPPQILALKNMLLSRAVNVSLGAIGEGTQELLENIGQDIVHIASTNAESHVALGEAIEAGGVGAIVGAVASSVIQGALHIKARGAQQTFEQLSDATQAQKLKERDPGTYQSLADAVVSHLAATTDEAVDALYVEATVFNQIVKQAGMDPQEVAKALPVVGEQLDEAAATGGDIAIPLSEYVGKLAGTELGDALSTHLRASPDALSMAELEIATKASGDLQKQADEILSKQEARQEWEKSANEVQKVIYDQIKATGIYSDFVSRMNASLARSFVVTAAEKMGVTPMEFYQAHPYKIVSGDIQSGQVTQSGMTDYIKEYSIDPENVEVGKWAGRVVFHGTEESSSVDIYKNGVDNSKSGKGYFGRGLYAASDYNHAKSQYAEFRDDDEGTPSVIALKIKDDARILDLRNAEDFETLQSISKNGRLVGSDDFDKLMVKNGVDGLFDRSFGGVVIYNPSAVIPIRTGGKDLFQTAPPINTPEFKNWFGDSKVVDEAGKPLVVYHGTDKEFDEFNTKDGKAKGKTKQQLDFGSHFGNQEYAKGYSKTGNTMPVYLSIKSPLNLADSSESMAYLGHPNFDRLVKLNKLLGIKPSGNNFYDRNGVKHDTQQNAYINQFALDSKTPAKVKKALMEVGFDGIIYKPYNMTSPSTFVRHPLSYVAFSPAQIKSVNNKGTFDPNDSNIYNQGGISADRVTSEEAALDWNERDNAVRSRIVQEFTSGKHSSMPWKTVPSGTIAKIWKDFSKEGIVRNEKGLNKALDQFIENAQRLKFNNEVAGHERYYPEEVLDDILENYTEDEEPSREEILEKLANWAVDLPDGGWRISDYGLPKIEKYLLLALDAKTAEEKIVYMDMALNVVHQRSDLASWFVTGGARALTDISNQSSNNALYQSAWHGSPYTFDKFSTSNIGTGEGRAAFGRGLYFAGKKEVAEYYKKKLSSFDRTKPDSEAIAKYKDKFDALVESHKKLANIPGEERSDIESQMNALHQQMVDETIKRRGKGRLYKVDLAPQEDEYLLWDKPLSEQSEKVQALIKPAIKQAAKSFPALTQNDPTGSGIYQALSQHRGNNSKAASEYLHSLGIRGIKYLDGSSRGTGEGNYNYVIFSDEDVSIIEMYQKAPGSKRGGFDPSRLTTILTQQSDYSTFLHETAHFFLTTYADMASDPNAAPRVREDMAALLEWFNVPDIQTWNNMPLDEQRKHHEAFAYNFELYLFEGKAPNVKMQSVFERFAAWLKKVYASIRGELNDIYRSEHGTDLPILTGEVRQVMDRMLASDRQIALAEQVRGMTPLFQTQEEAGMSDEEWAAYQDMQNEAHTDALAEHRAASMRQLKWASNAKSKVLKALQAEAKDARKVITDEVLKEIDSIPYQYGNRKPFPIYKAQAELKAAKTPLEKVAVADAYGMPLDELENAFTLAPTRKETIKKIVDKRMLEEHGELTDPKALADAVDAAVHNEARARFIGVELRHLSKSLRPVRVMQESARQAARAILGKKTIETIKPKAYAAAEAKAAAAAEQAMKDGDTALATQAKEKQLLQNQLAAEALKANGEILKALGEFKKVFTSDKRLAKSRDMNYIEVARAILAHYGVGSTEETPEFYLAKIKKYDPEFYAEIEEMITAHQMQAKPVKELTLEEFSDLRDQVSALWHLSRRNKQIEIDGKLIDRTAVVTELNSAIENLGVKKFKPGLAKAMTAKEDAKLLLMGVRAAMRRVEAWVDAMDKGNPGGPFRRYIWNPVSEAVVAYREAKKAYIAKYVNTLKDVEPLLKGGDIQAGEIGYTFTPQALLHALLHTGNSSNKKKLLVGRGWADTDLETGIVDTSRWDAFIKRLQDEGTLTKAHYDFAQKVWDLMEEMKPAAQKAHRQMYGFYFAEITAEPFEAFGNTYRGGYVPAVTDPKIVTESAVRNEQETTNTDNSFMFPSTGRGFTRSRVEYNRPLLLDLGFLGSHIDKVLRFTHVEPRIKDVARIVKTNRSFGRALDDIDPTARGDMLVPWLQRTAMQMVSIPSKGWGGKAADSFFSWLRTTTGLQMMVGNITNTIQQFTGVSISALKVPPKDLGRALWQYVKSPKETAALIMDKSAYMRTRINADQYELQRTMNELILNPNKYEKLQDFAAQHGYFLQVATQGVVDTIAWTGAYNNAVSNGSTEAEAVRQADAIVRMTQGSFAPEDVSRIETGHAFVRAFTHFYSYFNMMANVLGSEFTTAMRTKVGVPAKAGKMLYIYVVGFMVPAVLSEMIVQAIGGFDDGDDDEYGLWDAMRLFFGAQGRAIAGMFPGVGPAVIAGINSFNKKPYDDRMSTSPAVSAIEAAVRTPSEVYKAIAEDGSWKKASKDLLTTLGLITRLPLGQLGKPVGYLADVAQGKTEPESVMDLARGIVSGKDVNRKQ